MADLSVAGGSAASLVTRWRISGELQQEFVLKVTTVTPNLGPLRRPQVRAFRSQPS